MFQSLVVVIPIRANKNYTHAIWGPQITSKIDFLATGSFHPTRF